MFDAANTSFSEICEVAGRLYLESSLTSLQNQKHFDKVLEKFKEENEQLLTELRTLRIQIDELNANNSGLKEQLREQDTITSDEQ